MRRTRGLPVPGHSRRERERSGGGEPEPLVRRLPRDRLYRAKLRGIELRSGALRAQGRSIGMAPTAADRGLERELSGRRRWPTSASWSTGRRAGSRCGSHSSGKEGLLACRGLAGPSVRWSSMVDRQRLSSGAALRAAPPHAYGPTLTPGRGSKAQVRGMDRAGRAAQDVRRSFQGVARGAAGAGVRPILYRTHVPRPAPRRRGG